jgi:hypothetical protein
MEIYNCKLWEKAKVLAQERGFEMTPTCPLEKNCPEVRCTVIETAKDEEKLNALREELKVITDQKKSIMGY